MSISVTTIFYGVRIRSWQLIVAAHAFIRFAPLLKSLDIIILRRRNGTLQIGATSSGVRNIGDMPVEVLEMIRGQVFSKKELKRVANSLLFEGTGNWKKIPVPHGPWGGCSCWDDHFETLETSYIGYEPIHELVVSFGLSISFASP